MNNENGMIHILFLCTGNSARSILAEALANHMGDGRISAHSAGSFPKDDPHPLAIELLQEKKLPLLGLRSKSWNEFSRPDSPPVDFVITVCDQAAAESCPIWPGRPVRIHWGIADPAGVEGTVEEQKAAFEAAYATLEERIRAFVRLPVEDFTSLEIENHLIKIAGAA